MRPCNACGHSDRANLDADIIAGIEGDTAIGNKYGLHRLAISRHRSHVDRQAVYVEAAAELDASGNPDVKPFAEMSMQERRDWLSVTMCEVMQRAKINGDGRLIVASVNSVNGLMEQADKADKALGSVGAVPGAVQLLILPWSAREKIPFKNYPTPEQWEELIAAHQAASTHKPDAHDDFGYRRQTTEGADA